MHTKLLAVVLSLLVVIVVAWSLFGRDSAPDLPTAIPQHGPTVTQPEAEPQRGAPRGGEAVGLESQRVERTVVPAADESAPRACRVRGRLVDAGGLPRASVGVRMHSWLATADGVSPDLDAETKATTDREGRFVFEVLPGRNGLVNVDDDELVLVREPPRFEADTGDQDLGDLVAVRTGSLQGVVQDELGRPIAGVGVDAARGAFGFGLTSRTTTAEDGTFSVGKLRSGTWRLRTASSHYMPTTLEVVLADEQHQTGLVLVVRPGLSIAGQVVDDRGVGVAGVKVGGKRKESAGSMHIESFSAGEATTTDAAGFFTLAGLGEGMATIRAFGTEQTSHTVVEVPAGTGNVVLRVQRLATIEGVLVGEDGAPIAGSRVQAESGGRRSRDIDSFSLGARGDATTGDDGTFRIDSVAPGSVTLVARGVGHLPVRLTSVPVAPGEAVRGLRMVAAAGATAHVLVVDPDGEPVPGARVKAQRLPRRAPATGDRHVVAGEAWPDPGEALGAAVTDAEGSTLLRGLPAGEAVFTAEHDAFAAAEAVPVVAPNTGTCQVRLVLTKPGFVEVHVVEAAGHDAVNVEVRVALEGHFVPSAAAPTRPTRTATTDAKGRSRIGPLAPGNYGAELLRRPDLQSGGEMMFSFGDDDSEVIVASRQSCVVVAGETTRLELRRPVLARLHGTVSGADGALTGCIVELQRRGDSAGGPLGFGARHVRTAVDGTFAFAEVEAGAYTLHFGRNGQAVKARQDVDVPPGSTEVRRDLALRTGKVVVRVHDANTGDPIEGAELQLHLGGSEDRVRKEHEVVMSLISSSGEGGEAMTMTIGGRNTRTGRDGRIEIDDVPVGIYSVRVEHEGHEAVDRPGQIVAERQTTDCGRIDLVPTGGK